MKPGQKASLIFEEMRSNRISGVVKTIYPDEGQFFVKILVTDLPPSILPGITADVAIEVGSKENALLVPTKAILAGQVVRVRQGKRQKVAVVG